MTTKIPLALIADDVKGMLSDAVSQGNVPIYATAVGMAALEVPEGINAFRTNGYYAADGKGSALYRLMSASEAVQPGELLTNGGAKPLWMKFSGNGNVGWQSVTLSGTGGV